jgi:small subunit ribosomal protein S1
MNTFKYKPEGWNNEITTIERDNINKSLESDEILQGLVKECDEQYNLHINLGNGITGIIPREEVEAINTEEDGLPKTNLCTGKVHKFVQFKVKGQKDDNTLILSRKEVQKEALNWIKRDLQIGQKVIGIVKNIKPYGAFVEIGGGVVGLVHIEDLSIARIKSPFERLKIGQKVDVVVKYIDKIKGKVILSYKETLGTWEENAKKFEAGTKTRGIVRETEKNKNGIFIELTPNLVGMAEYEEGLEYGQVVDVYIKKIDNTKRKVKLLIAK